MSVTLFRSHPFSCPLFLLILVLACLHAELAVSDPELISSFPRPFSSLFIQLRCLQNCSNWDFWRRACQ